MLKLSKNLILGSASPRRQQILRDCGFDFSIQIKPTDESFDPNLASNEVPGFLASAKAAEFKDLKDHEILLCADTVVILGQEILNKPKDYDEAFEMLSKLSGVTHQVITAVCIKTIQEETVISDSALVTFKILSSIEKNYYIETCRPYDKAGSYGVQDFIGMAGIENIQGSFYTIMGLPIHLVYKHLQKYI